MAPKLTKAELVELVEKVKHGSGTPQELDAWLQVIEDSIPVPDGYLSDLIFWSSKHGLGPDPTAEEIVNKALSYRPTLL